MAKEEQKKLVTPVFRISFPNLFVARASQDDPTGTPKFGCSAIWTPAAFSDTDKARWSALLAELDACSKAAFKKAWKDLGDGYKKGLRKGEDKEGLAGYGEGTRFANLTSKHPPGVVDAQRRVISIEEGNTELIYPGCYCRATVNVYSYSNKGKGTAIGLRNVQLVKNGPRLDNRTAAKDDFADDLDSKWMDDADGDFGGAGDDEISF